MSSIRWCEVRFFAALQLPYRTDFDASLVQAVEEKPLPFFIEWPCKEEQPDQVIVDHVVDPMV